MKNRIQKTNRKTTATAIGRKLIALMLVVFMLTGCGSASDHMVKAAMPKEDASNKENLNTWVEKGQSFNTRDFDEKMISTFLRGDENTVISPLNVFIAMSMLTESCDGETQKEILQLLGSDDVTALREKAKAMFNANYIDDENATKIANSIWLNDQVKFRKELLETYANEYYASSFYGKMGTSEMDQLLRDWVNENTGNLLKEEAENIKTSPETLVEILSTILFQAEWAEENKFEEALTESKGFAGGKVTKDVPMMRTSFEGEVYETKQLAACELKLKQGKMCFFKPKDGTQIDEILESGGITEALHRHDTGMTPVGNSRRYDTVNFEVPKFDIHGETEMIQGLQELGVNRVFAPETAEMQGLFDKNENAQHAPYVSRIHHAAMVKIDEKGVKGAAFTEIMETDGAIEMEEPSVYDFILDEPFIYTILGEDGSILFAGTVRDV